MPDFFAQASEPGNMTFRLHGTFCESVHQAFALFGSKSASGFDKFLNGQSRGHVLFLNSSLLQNARLRWQRNTLDLTNPTRALSSTLSPRRWLRHRIPPNLNPDRKSTRLNSSHRTISYAVFCLKKK